MAERATTACVTSVPTAVPAAGTTVRRHTTRGRSPRASMPRRKSPRPRETTMSDNHRVPRDRALQPDIAEDASVKVIGLGGVGGIVARYGAMFLASLGRPVRLVLIDG